MKKVGISMPVANEEATIHQFLADLIQKLSQLDFALTVYVIMDNFSKDNTFNMVQEITARDPRINLVFYRESTGVVSCYLKGLKMALEDGCDYLIEMDS